MTTTGDVTPSAMDAAVNWAVRVSAAALVRSAVELKNANAEAHEVLTEASVAFTAALTAHAVTFMTKNSQSFARLSAGVDVTKLSWKLVSLDDDRPGIVADDGDVTYLVAMPSSYNVEVTGSLLDAQTRYDSARKEADECRNRYVVVDNQLIAMREKLLGDLKTEIVRRALVTGVPTPKSILKEVVYYAVHGKWSGAVTASEVVT